LRWHFLISPVVASIAEDEVTGALEIGLVVSMRRMVLLVMAAAMGLLAMGAGAAVAGHSNARTHERQALAQRADDQSRVLGDYFERARSIILLTAHNPTFAAFYSQPGAHGHHELAGGPLIEQANGGLAYLEQLYPDRIGEACFIDANGKENARVTHGDRAAADKLSPDEARNPFFAPTFALPPGDVYQAKPYVSPDTYDWVISNSTLVPSDDGAKNAIVHFEIGVESFRRDASASSSGGTVLVVDADSGAVVLNTAHPQRVGAALGDPSDKRFAALVPAWNVSGRFHAGGLQGAYRSIPAARGNANRWYAVAVAERPSTVLTGIGAASIILVAMALLLMCYGAALLRRGQRLLVDAANTDPLTGLHNRRRLVADLKTGVGRAGPDRPLLLILCDLNGFKAYNDLFGHPAGDALLSRLGLALSTALEGRGAAYRIGGDEFCVLAQPGRDGIDDVIARTVHALSERGDGFSITASHGSVLLPDQTLDTTEAIRLADQRMYEEKSSGRMPADTQTANALLRVLHERDPELTGRLNRTGEMAAQVTRQLGLSNMDQAQIRQAAQLHDIGKIAVPDSILRQRSPLEPADWAFLQQCPTIGQRITAAAPALAPLAPMIRSSRERFDGTGYPDRLVGDQILLGARIIAVCSAMVAMTSYRPYAPILDTATALAELGRSVGSQFDPVIVEALAQVLNLDEVHVSPR
jgi:diguanylate cyclase (GGDEF)-like protein